MTKEEAIYEAIMNCPTITHNVDKRIYPLVAPYGVKEFPYIVYSQMSRVKMGTKDSDEREVIVAFSVVSKSYKQAHDIAALIPGALYDAQVQTITEEGNLECPNFLAETEMYNTDSDTFMVKVELSYEYYQ